ncbi:MAG: tetratricopeptide repeat protein, partial [Wolbachia endosymbiont of Menacanthus eurysternus]|nr:tetratricopeptide repeat protein [Wolbachia endosymbiont of Menacanthus eurysternus]
MLQKKGGHKKVVIYLLDEETKILCREGEGEKALEAYKEMFDIQKNEFGCNHPDTLRTQYNMALVLDYLYEWNEALQTYQEVFEKRRDVLGLDHPRTLETHNKIEGMREKIRRNEQNLQLARENAERRREEEWETSEPVVTYEDIKRQAKAYAQRKRLEAAAGGAQPGSFHYYQRTEHIRREHDNDSCLIQLCQEQQKAYFHLSQFISHNAQNASIKPVKQGLYLPSFETRNVEVNGKCTAITRGFSQGMFSNQHRLPSNNLQTS